MCLINRGLYALYLSIQKIDLFFDVNFSLKREEMEYKTQSMTVIVRSDDIIELVTNDGWDKVDTIETATENASVLKKSGRWKG